MGDFVLFRYLSVHTLSFVFLMPSNMCNSSLLVLGLFVLNLYVASLVAQAFFIIHR